jgi:hypothetical protein
MFLQRVTDSDGPGAAKRAASCLEVGNPRTNTLPPTVACALLYLTLASRLRLNTLGGACPAYGLVFHLVISNGDPSLCP